MVENKDDNDWGGTTAAAAAAADSQDEDDSASSSSSSTSSMMASAGSRISSSTGEEVEESVTNNNKGSPAVALVEDVAAPFESSRSGAQAVALSPEASDHAVAAATDENDEGKEPPPPPPEKSDVEENSSSATITSRNSASASSAPTPPSVNIDNEDNNSSNDDGPRNNRAKNMARRAKKIGVGIAGGTMVGVGTILIPTVPPPFGEVLIAGGVSLLATEFEAPKRVVKSARDSLVKVCAQDEEDEEEENEQQEIEGTTTTTATSETSSSTEGTTRNSETGEEETIDFQHQQDADNDKEEKKSDDPPPTTTSATAADSSMNGRHQSTRNNGSSTTTPSEPPPRAQERERNNNNNNKRRSIQNRFKSFGRSVVVPFLDQVVGDDEKKEEEPVDTTKETEKKEPAAADTTTHHQPPSSSSTRPTMQDRFKNFGRSVVVPFLDQVNASLVVDQSTTTKESKEMVAWLMRVLEPVPSDLELPLVARQVYEASRLTTTTEDDDAAATTRQQQDALFDALGASPQAMQAMCEIMPRIHDIAKIQLDDLLVLVNDNDNNVLPQEPAVAATVAQMPLDATTSSGVIRDTGPPKTCQAEEESIVFVASSPTSKTGPDSSERASENTLATAKEHEPHSEEDTRST